MQVVIYLSVSTKPWLSQILDIHNHIILLEQGTDRDRVIEGQLDLELVRREVFYFPSKVKVLSHSLLNTSVLIR